MLMPRTMVAIVMALFFHSIAAAQSIVPMPPTEERPASPVPPKTGTFKWKGSYTVTSVRSQTVFNGAEEYEGTDSGVEKAYEEAKEAARRLSYHYIYTLDRVGERGYAYEPPTVVVNCQQPTSMPSCCSQRCSPDHCECGRTPGTCQCGSRATPRYVAPRYGYRYYYSR